MLELVYRLEQIRVSLGLSKATFSEFGRVKASAYSNWLAGLSNPTLSFILDIKKKYPKELDLEWLFMGIPRTSQQLIVAETESSYNNMQEKLNNCEKQVSIAYQLIDTLNATIESQKQTIAALQTQVSTGVSKK